MAFKVADVVVSSGMKADQAVIESIQTKEATARSLGIDEVTIAGRYLMDQIEPGIDGFSKVGKAFTSAKTAVKMEVEVGTDGFTTKAAVGEVEHFAGEAYPSSAASHVRYKESLVREGQIASLNSGEYEAVIAGQGSTKALKDAPRLAATYGGDPSDWSKVTSYSHKFDKSGIRIEYHAYKNMRTNQIVEIKPK